MGLDLTEFIAKSKFNRYDMNETNTIVRQLLEIKRSLFDDFLDSIADKFTVKMYKGVAVDYITCDDFMYWYDLFMRNSKYKQSPTSITNELTMKGFTKQRFKVNNERFYVYYRQHVEKCVDGKMNDDDDDDCEEFDDEIPVKESI